MSTPPVTPDPRIVSRPASELRQRFLEFFAERDHTVVPSASLVPAGDQTLLFTNSGMVQFKDALTGAEQRSYKRAVDYQRALRVAGKHNDFEEVGRTPRHHTLFEMLGNFSFGDYFKREAIHYAWDFLTRDLGIPGDKLAATTYTTDDLAFEVWRDEIGLPPDRLVRWGDFPNGDEKNWWRMGDVGPSGPCSEIHFDRGAQLSEGPHCIPDHSETCPRWLEIWNLVFMEFDLQADGSLVPLPAPGVDTGMGLERLASVVQQVPTNYDTDLFTPIHARMRELLGHDPDAFEQERFSYQVIADHSRAVTFLIGDDVLPSNEGRGYVLRRILRRAVRHGRLLGRREPFMAETAAVVIDVMAEAYPHLAEKREAILETIAREEAQFARTLDSGSAILHEEIAQVFDRIPTPGRRGHVRPPGVVGRRPEDLPADAPVLPGEVAFRLHDTYGFPVDLTAELAAEYGVRLDREGFEAALAEQRERSRSGKKAELAKYAEQASLYSAIQGRVRDTEFLGYETTAAEGRVAAIVRDGMEFDELTGHGAAEVILDRTPFYAEGGGQVGDQGVIREPGGGSELFTVEDTQRPVGGLIVHRGTLRGRLKVGETVEAVVDAERRAHTMRNHTGTHLLHRALRNVVGQRARQAGSLVHPDNLRFDYPFDRALTVDEKRAIEDEVRAIIRDDRQVTVAFMSMEQAIEQGADAFFDEKYGETVRTVRVEDYSFELCGGTHCRATGQIGGFVITGERSIGSGQRRIEALTGAGADRLIRERVEALERVAETVGASSVERVDERVAALQDELRETKRRLRESGSDSPPKPSEIKVETLSVQPAITASGVIWPFPSPSEMKSYARELKTAVGSNTIYVGRTGLENELFVTADEELSRYGISVGQILGGTATRLGGRGGGTATMAQARFPSAEAVEEAAKDVREQIRKMFESQSEG
jgi:alanyl-tRNA synthetase